MTEFTKKIEGDDCLMTSEEWLANVKCGGFIDYDGYGYLSNGKCKSDEHIIPSKSHLLPKDATHIVWINR